MSEKPISPLRQRMIEDMTVRTIRAVMSPLDRLAPLMGKRPEPLA
jgi:hypothetical protein